MDLATFDYRKLMVTKAKAYAVTHDISLARVGKIVMNDQAFFKQMEDGDRGCTVDTFQYVMRWFEENTAPVPKRDSKGKPNRHEVFG